MPVDFKVAFELDTRLEIFSPLRCRLDEIFAAASDPFRRVSVQVRRSNPLGPLAGDREMEWFPAGSTPFGVDCLSGLLSDTSWGRPRYFGWLQIHRGRTIWLGWDGEQIGVDWSDVRCIMTTLYFADQYGRSWEIYLDAWYKGILHDRSRVPRSKILPDAPEAKDQQSLTGIGGDAPPDRPARP
jgi:hypothetical protein